MGRVPVGLLTTQADATLCAFACRGHSAAYEALYSRYHSRISRFIAHMIGSRRDTEDVADIAQDVFVAAFGALRTRSRDRPFRPWLYTIARNRTIDHIRACQPAMTELDTEQLAGGGEPDDAVDRRDDLAWVVDALDALPARQREALVLREFGGLSYAEIAVTLGTSTGAVKQLLTRGRAALTEAATKAGVGRRPLADALAAAAGAVATAGDWPAIAAQLGLSVSGGAFAGKLATAACAAALVGGGGAMYVGDFATERRSSDDRSLSTAPDWSTRASHAITLSPDLVADRSEIIPPPSDRIDAVERDNARSIDRAGDPGTSRRSRGRRGNSPGAKRKSRGRHIVRARIRRTTARDARQARETSRSRRISRRAPRGATRSREGSSRGPSRGTDRTLVGPRTAVAAPPATGAGQTARDPR